MLFGGADSKLELHVAILAWAMDISMSWAAMSETIEPRHISKYKHFCSIFVPPSLPPQSPLSFLQRATHLHSSPFIVLILNHVLVMIVKRIIIP